MEKKTAPNLTVGVATPIAGPPAQPTIQVAQTPVRMLMSLTERQQVELKKKADERGISIQEAVRQILDKHLFGEI